MPKHYKIISFNPDQYEKIDEDEALIGYRDYINSIIKSETLADRTPKTFNEWLETEI